MTRERQAELARKNLERRLAPLRQVNFARPPKGWIRALRDALGMSSRQLAKRLGVVQSRIVALERAEKAGGTTLKSLREVADAMNCTLVYALVPNEPLDKIVERRAREKAASQAMTVSHAMLLENQSLTVEQAREEIERLTREILSEPLRYLWEDE